MNASVNLRLAPLLTLCCCCLAACGQESAPAQQGVVSSGKQARTLDEVPPEVLQAARQAVPELDIESAEHEVRDGRDYYDLEGTMPDGSELELDLTMVDSVWSVVEMQRDITLGEVPEEVRETLSAAHSGWSPRRIIESDQGGGVIVYEFFGPGPDGQETKVEVKWEYGVAELLLEEWLH